ncbi:low molecular weight phosphotyrosine protein phosphatase [Lewinella lacunae]|uniref:protein-tyrosine-phosphatase n=2 Tax=Neolewinella lacunae TaxID=1517758 RepID=A0A923PPX1_9BACT|nr:low molecular weight phosphotyrosine protein phosphatase [Neolewinella lacunae]
MRILNVCLGNICRSPLAEGLLRRAVEARGLSWEISSSGTANYHVGKAPDRRSVAIGKAHQLDISGQRAQQVTRADLDHYDLILAMDRQNLADLQALATTPAQLQKIHLFLDFAGLRATEGPDVPDPYWDDSGFASVYALLERAAERIVERLVD